MFKQVIVWLRLNSSSRHIFCLTLLVLFSLKIEGAHGSSAHILRHHSPLINSPEQQPVGAQSPVQNATVLALEPGRAIEREISSGETHNYRVTAGTGDFVGVTVRQIGVDVGEKLFAPDGKLIAAFNAEVRPQGEERADFVAETAGTYRLDVEPQLKRAAGRYEISVTQIRAATEAERALHETHKLLAQADTLADADKYNDMLPLLTRALELGEKTLGPDDPYVAYLLVQLGRCHDTVGNFAQAERLFQRALAIDKQALGLAHPQTAEALYHLGTVYIFTNEHAKAEELLQQALALTEQTLGPEHPRVIDLLRNFGLLYYYRGDLARAEQTTGRALAIADKVIAPDDFLLVQVLNNLGQIYSANRDYARAEPLLSRSLEIAEKKFGSESYTLSMQLQNLGLIAHEYRKDYPRALQLYWRAEKILEKSVGPESPDAAGILNNIANIYKARGEYAKALELHQRVHAIWEKSLGPYTGNTLISLGNIARTYAAMGDIPNAVRSQIVTDEAIERNLLLNLAIGSERQKIAFFGTLADRTDRTVSLHVRLAPHDPIARDLAAQVILQRKGRVLDAMSGGLAALRQHLNDQDRKLLDQLNTTTAQLARVALGGRGKTPADEYQKQLSTLWDQKEKLEGEISRRSAEFRVQSQTVTLAAVQAAIPRDTALVEFSIYRPFDPAGQSSAHSYGKPRYIAYILRPQGEVQWQELGPAGEIDAGVDALRQALGDPERSDVQQLARAVDEKVFRPVRALLGGARQLLMSPDGELNLLPFAALVDERGHYLLERYSFAYLTSGRDLLRLQVRRESKGPPVVIAEPAFGAPALKLSSGGAESNGSAKLNAKPQVDYSQIFFGPLPGVSEEVRALKELLPQATFLTKEQATKAALKSLSGPSILHIATHGFFLRDEAQATAENRGAPQAKDGTRLGKLVAHVENPLLRSGLALAGANQSVNGNTDGILTALEVSGLDLWGTKLVVLSACDTGVGEVKNGDGVYGLRRALVLAGAESQVMSLWAVSDRSTRDLIVGYYKALLQGEGRGEALRQAQLNMLKDSARRHPYYWASFIQAGEWANIEGKR
jgi:CHAT domain-containing protein